MREIKFRAWDSESDEMINWNNLILDYNFGLVLQSHNESDTYLKIMQYTGLKDKNGTEIYEGDIVKIKHDDIRLPKIDVVAWCDWKAKFVLVNHIDDMRYEEYQYEVIGNIHENPELLIKNKS